MTSKLNKDFSTFITRLIDELFPSECLVCGLEGDWLCADCHKQTLAIKSPTCPFCDRLAPLGKTCTHCRRQHVLNGARSLWYYNPTSRTFIHRFKYDGIKSSQQFVAPQLAELVNELPLSKLHPVYLTAVPSRPQRIKQYGFNQSELLAKTVAKTTGLPYAPLLRRRDATVSQTQLNRNERLANLQASVTLMPKHSILTNTTVIILDDVITTGATLSACAAVLKQAGAKQVWAITIAKD